MEIHIWKIFGTNRGWEYAHMREHTRLHIWVGALTYTDALKFIVITESTNS